MSDFLIRCRKCRHVLFTHPSTPLLNAHRDIVALKKEEFDQRDQLCENSLLYLNEESIPEWVSDRVDKIHWLKGKLHCPACNTRIGALDFVSGSKCVCGSNVLPAIHLVKSKLDLMTKQLDTCT